jgi:CRP/FNR family transcriptional regulator/CRP/FNR family nitrogen fixation transcriptional regulator
MMLARKSAMEKVASFLLELSNRTGTPSGNHVAFPLPMLRADIADFLGLTIETVSRMFSQLRKAGTIALETPQKVLVLDMQALIDATQAD